MPETRSDPAPHPDAAALNAARRLVRQAVSAGGHLSYEQLEAYVDDRADAAVRERVAGHAAWCAACGRQLQDLQAHAATLRQRPAPAHTGWRAWFKPGAGRSASRSAWPALAVACSVAMVAVLLGQVRQSHQIDPDLDERALASAPAGSVPAGAAEAVRALDPAAWARLGRVSVQAEQAYRAGDYRRLATLLQPAADAGRPEAAAALGLQYAQGLGVPRDLARARRYLDVAARAGDEPSRRNLALVAGWR